LGGLFEPLESRRIQSQHNFPKGNNLRHMTSFIFVVVLERAFWVRRPTGLPKKPFPINQNSL